jgi:hypothetical protein
MRSPQSCPHGSPTLLDTRLTIRIASSRIKRRSTGRPVTKSRLRTYTLRLAMKLNRSRVRAQNIALAIVVLWGPFSPAQERPTILAGHGTLSGSILPLWVAAEAKLFDKHGLQVRPIYLPRAAGRAALVSGDIQVYFSVLLWCRCVWAGATSPSHLA